MRSRFLSSAVLSAAAVPALAFGTGHHVPAAPGFGIARAVHIVASTVRSITIPAAHAAPRRHAIHHVTHVTPRHVAPRQVVIDCRGDRVVRPRTFQLACADGNDNLSKLRWVSWSRGYATAAGIQTMNDCAPTCADGKFRTYPVRVVLWGTAVVPGHPAERRYTMITLLYTGKQPSVSNGATRMAGPPSVTGTLWS